MKSFAIFWKNYVNFSGRTNRKNYWLAILFNTLILFALYTIDLQFTKGNNDDPGILSLVYTVAIIIPMLSINVRRMHDQDKCGFWILIRLVPFIGSIWYFILLVSPGTYYENSYGASEDQLDYLNNTQYPYNQNNYNNGYNGYNNYGNNPNGYSSNNYLNNQNNYNANNNYNNYNNQNSYNANNNYNNYYDQNNYNGNNNYNNYDNQNNYNEQNNYNSNNNYDAYNNGNNNSPNN